MDTDGADDLFGEFAVKSGGDAASPSKAKAGGSKAKAKAGTGAKKKGEINVIYEDEFEQFHLTTQERCEELCNIIIEKLEEAGKKGHMRGELEIHLLLIGCLLNI